MSRIGPTPQTKTTPIAVKAPPRRLPAITIIGFTRPRRCTAQGSGLRSAVSLIQRCVLGSSLSDFRSHYHPTVGVSGIVREVIVVVIFSNKEVD